MVWKVVKGNRAMLERKVVKAAARFD